MAQIERPKWGGVRRYNFLEFRAWMGSVYFEIQEFLEEYNSTNSSGYKLQFFLGNKRYADIGQAWGIMLGHRPHSSLESVQIEIPIAGEPMRIQAFPLHPKDIKAITLTANEIATTWDGFNPVLRVKNHNLNGDTTIYALEYEFRPPQAIFQSKFN